jgi:peptidoglycan hydrolase-like protein with peptidoglycan-binding domain
MKKRNKSAGAAKSAKRAKPVSRRKPKATPTTKAASPNEKRNRRPRRPPTQPEVRVAIPVVTEGPRAVAASTMRLLTLNRKGDDVASWQQFLVDHGFDPGPVDGFFGGATRRATMDFQKQHHLTPDGVVGGTTRAAAGPIGFVAAVAQAIHGVVHDEDDVIDHIGGVPIFETQDARAIYFKTGMTIDADGAYRAYKIRNLGLDFDDNGKNPCAPNGRWIGVVVNSAGTPIPQGPNDPRPGFLISTTSLQDPTRANTDPQRYVDSEAVPFIVLPGGHLGRASLGDYALVVNTANGKMVHAIAADAGPKHHVGEASIAVARELLGEAASNPRSGGTERAIIRYIVFPGSGDGRFPSSDPREPAILQRTMMHLNTTAATLFAALDPAHQASLMT